MPTILIVEDDTELLDLFHNVLENENYNVVSATNGVEALDIVSNQHIDLIVSDVMMPEMDGYEMVKLLRLGNYTMPILLITALGGISNKKEGFRVGTDDYMVKPIDVNEMVWRIDALLRRSKIDAETILKIGSTTLNQDALTIEYNNTNQELPQKEFLLLFKLLSSMNKIYTRRQIFDDVWGMESDTDLHTLDVHISRLRSRLKDNKDFKITTVRGLGYKAVLKHEEE